MRAPDFSNLLAVLDRKAPSRPTLFEFFLNWDLHVRLAGPKVADVPEAKRDRWYEPRLTMAGFLAAGYDFVTMMPSGPDAFHFPQREKHRQQTVSLNEGDMITDRASLEAYPWMDPDKCNYDVFDALARELPPGAKFVAYGPSGVLENAIALVGFERLCIITMTDPELAADIFARIGSSLVRYYEICASFPSVGACISNDDWGFKNQTMLSPQDMRTYVFPWHKKIVEAIHKAGKPAILHSCGNLEAVMDDVIDDMKFDGKHSYEDAIMPVEDAYERWGRRIAILGGIDVDFLIRSSVDEVRKRSSAMLERTKTRGSYALGSGNSIPAYVPQEKYLAMVRCATEG